VNLPNILTLARIFLVPVLVVVILTRFEGKEVVALAIFLVAALTDWLDGYLARKRRQVTVLGMLLDPIADKILISGAFISLVEMHEVSGWLVTVIIAREFAVDGLRMVAATRGVTIAASRLGKMKMVAETTTISVVLLGTKFLGVFIFVGHVLLWITMAVAVGSGIDYFVRFYRKVQSTGFAAKPGHSSEQTSQAGG